MKAPDRLSTTALVQCVFAEFTVVLPSPLPARRLCLLPVSVTGDQGTSCFVNHVLKCSMHSLQGTQAAGQCSLFDLQPVPSRITSDVQLLRMSQRTCHKTGGPERSKVQIIPLPKQYIHCTSLITGSQHGSVSLVLETGTFSITHGA